MTASDIDFMREAIKEAILSENEGNLPVGTVIVLNGQIISRGRNKIFQPEFHPLAHAEIEAIRNLDKAHLEAQSKSMTLYTTCEPCVMCVGAIIIHRLGRVVFGARDINRGACYLSQGQTLSPIYTPDRLPVMEGPIMQEECGPLFERSADAYNRRRG